MLNRSFWSGTFPGYLQVAAVLIAATTLSVPVLVQSQDRVYVVTHIEGVPSRVGELRQHLTTYREAVRKAPGHLRVDALQELGRLERFAVLSVWDNQRA